MHGVRLLQSGVANRGLVGGVDALSKFTLNGFNSLMILDKAHCRPFDNSRAGLNLGEGAGFLLLESSPNVSDDSDILCELTGWANANDAYHQTASSPEGIGAFKAMNEAITQSGINPAEIDYINAHGTGTQNNDYSEGVAIKRLFGTNIPAFSSTKAYTGHTLGAAAGIEAVFSVLAILNNCVFPNLNFKTPMDELNITPQLSFEKRQINHVLSNSFGFGGNNSSLIFSKNK
jgi:3-oxoacyl-[acyl-carrier-protein] synthase-1